MNVKIVKLTSGEELFGEFDEETNVIKNPLASIFFKVWQKRKSNQKKSNQKHV